METVLFICSYNSVRSQIAEALLRARCGKRYEVFSAGIAPAGINPYAVKVMQEIGIDMSQARSKSLTVFAGKKFDHVVTLCDQARLLQVPFLTEPITYTRGSSALQRSVRIKVRFLGISENSGTRSIRGCWKFFRTAPRMSRNDEDFITGDSSFRRAAPPFA